MHFMELLGCLAVCFGNMISKRIMDINYFLNKENSIRDYVIQVHFYENYEYIKVGDVLEVIRNLNDRIELLERQLHEKQTKGE